MAQLQNAFDATKVDPSQGVGQLPVGNKLPVTITESEVKATKDNSGGYIQFTVQIGQGEHAGRRGAYRINLYNSSEAARAIAEKQLSALCHVTGVFHLENTQQIHNIPFLIDVVAQAADPKYTEVKAVYDANGNEPGKAHSQANTQHNGGNNPANAGGWGQNTQTQQTQQTQQNQPGWGANNQQPNNQQQAENQQPVNQGNAQGGWNQSNPQTEQTQQQSGGWQQNNNGNAGSQPAWAVNK